MTSPPRFYGEHLVKGQLTLSEQILASAPGHRPGVDPISPADLLESPKDEASHYGAGRMFWFTRKRFAGSYFFLMA